MFHKCLSNAEDLVSPNPLSGKIREKDEERLHEIKLNPHVVCISSLTIEFLSLLIEKDDEFSRNLKSSFQGRLAWVRGLNICYERIKSVC